MVVVIDTIIYDGIHHIDCEKNALDFGGFGDDQSRSKWQISA
jgi:hypothetical protein